MFSKLFNKNKSKPELTVPEDANWGFIGTDIHSHLIPGIDDGAKTNEDSIALITAMTDMGFNRIVTTPHIMIDYYQNNSNIINTGLEKLKPVLAENNISVPIKAAAEYYIDETFTQLVEKEPLLCINKNEVLVEFSMMYEPPMLFQVIFNMITTGYHPIIAHPERYTYFFNKMDRFHDLKDRGCYFQLNMLSLSGYYGPTVKKIAEKLMEEKLYDYTGTDMHHEKHAMAIKNMLQLPECYFALLNYPFLNSRLTF